MGKDIATLTFDTFNDLRKTIGAKNASVHVLGKDQVNDGFGGLFYWDDISELPDDNLNALQKAGKIIGRWRRMQGISGASVVYTQNTSTITFSGSGTAASPLQATYIGSGGGGGGYNEMTEYGPVQLSVNTIRSQTAYVPGSIKLYRNGVRQFLGDDYFETSNNTIELFLSLTGDEKVIIDYKTT